MFPEMESIDHWSYIEPAPGLDGNGQNAMTERLRESNAVGMPGCVTIKSEHRNNAFTRESNRR